MRPPEMAGAAAWPTAVVAIQALNAVTWSLPLNSMGMIASVAGRMAAAPTPIRARPAISMLVVGARAASTEAAAKMTRPMPSTRRRPKMSPRRPAAMTSAPQTSVKMVLTHCSAVTEPPRSSEMAVVATGMLAAANQTMAAERQRATSDHQRLAPAGDAAGGLPAPDTALPAPAAEDADGEATGEAAVGRPSARRLAGLAHAGSDIPAMKSASASVQRSSSARSTLSLGAWILHMGSSAPQRIISAPGIAARKAATSGIEPPSP